MPVPKTDALPLGYTPYGLLKGWLAHLTDDEILERFDRILKSLSNYSELWSFRSRCSRLPRFGSRSNRNLYALVGFRLNLIVYLSGANKSKSFRMGSSSDAEPIS